MRAVQGVCIRIGYDPWSNFKPFQLRQDGDYYHHPSFIIIKGLKL